uniref:Uncharacterized protein n=1 Tax=viral metagenome TaxID=1070528 RepID=A0A6C0HBL0_9ZZZZ
MTKTKFTRSSCKGHRQNKTNKGGNNKSKKNKSKKNKSKKGGDFAGFASRMLGKCDKLRKDRINNAWEMYYNNLGNQKVTNPNRITDSLKGIPKIPKCDGTYEDFEPTIHKATKEIEDQ